MFIHIDRSVMLQMEKRILSTVGFEALIYDSLYQSLKLYFIDFEVSNKCKLEDIHNFEGLNSFIGQLKELSITMSFCLLWVIEANFCNSHEKAIAVIYYSFELLCKDETMKASDAAKNLIYDWVRIIALILDCIRAGSSLQIFQS